MFTGGHDARAFVGDVVLHAGLGVNGELSLLVDGPTEASVVLAGIAGAVAISLGVVNVVLGTVGSCKGVLVHCTLSSGKEGHTEALGGDFELLASIAKGHEAKNAEEQTDGLRGHRLDGSDIDGLGVVSQPVTEVDLASCERWASRRATPVGQVRRPWGYILGRW